jgi:hypothetical protein
MSVDYQPMRVSLMRYEPNVLQSIKEDCGACVNKI